MAITNYLNKVSARKLTWITAGVVAIVCASIVFSAQISSAWTMATTHQPEQFTELYFLHETQLPVHATAGLPQVFTFHLANHEEATRTYDYQVSQTDGSGTRVIAQGATVLPNGGQIDKTVAFQIAKPRTQVVISVTLIGMDQQIDFRSQS